MEIRTNVLILGGGPAGIQASRMIRNTRPEWQVTMLRPEPASMIYCAIPYVLEGLVDTEKVYKSDSLVTDVGVHLIKENAVEIDLRNRIVHTSNNAKITYDQILIATGAEAFIPPVPGCHLNHIETVKTGADTQQILAHMANGAKKVVVIGAGAIGLEQALAYRNRGLEVHLADLSPRVLPHLTDGDMTRDAQKLLEDAGIVMHLNTPLKAFSGKEYVSLVELGNGHRIELNPGRDFAVVCVGTTPNVDLFHSQLEIGNDGIIVNHRMETGLENTYAAGDCVQGWSGIDGKPLGGKLATNAVPMAKIAAANMLGKDAFYPGFFNGAVTTVDKLRIGGTGFTEAFARSRGFEVATGFGESLSRFPMMPDAKPVRIKLIAEIKSGRILGGQVTGYEAVAERIDVITLAIQRKMTATELTSLSYSAQPWQTFFPAKNAIVEAAANLAKECR